MSDELSITPRNLGSISLAVHCPRCFFYLLRMRFHPPFNSFGAAIFNDMQKMQEAVIGAFLETKGSLPKEFSPFCDCSSRADFPHHWSKFKFTHETGVILYGAPDEIFVLKSGDLCVIDHKTAHNKGHDDPYHGQYRVQVVGYANIAEGLHIGTVTLGGLLYWDAQRDTVLTSPSDYYSKGVLTVPFIPKPLEVKIDYSILDPLLKEALTVWNADNPPDGRSGCKDCKKLDFLFGIEQQMIAKDAALLRKHPQVMSLRREITVRDYNRNVRMLDAMQELRQNGESIFEPEGMVANWEFPEATMWEGIAPPE
jgi:hypothetical protein